MSEATEHERIRDADRTRAELLQVATEVFAEQGLSGARVDEIAERDPHHQADDLLLLAARSSFYRASLRGRVPRIREAEQDIHAGDLPGRGGTPHRQLTFDHHHAHPAFIRLVSIENIHRGSTCGRSTCPRLSNPVATLLDDVPPATRRRHVPRGRGRDRRNMLISSYRVFQVANNSTLPVRARHVAPDVRPTTARCSRHRGRLGSPALTRADSAALPRPDPGLDHPLTPAHRCDVLHVRTR
jgi:hypothetical protein